ncbi:MULTISPECIES: ArsR family transcriptional regulator [Thermococcus]|nr:MULTISPECIES: ArsR family transcriptional regulator [Thermococcus]KUK16703.1 MAG: Archaeal heat shock regulator, ArsR family [Thermococcus sibiricus]KUK29351.1 MAG: Archaeal heat shock regulator, ArsR family [Thermococcus sp. 40_45]MBC7094655.1 ArsR family transcriptional regulator [Thermococcus sp.]HII67867.1 ArsR family transcriptional regulator [Thermococcaceae archaeon]
MEEHGRLLDVLGNETRRRILLLLTKRPYFISELSKELNVGQKAVLEHLRILEGAGLIEGRVEKIPRGRPRKYYQIKRGIRLEVLLTPYSFGTEMYEPKAPRTTKEYEEVKQLIKSRGPVEIKVKELADFLNEIEERIEEYMKMKSELEEVRMLAETYMRNLMMRVAKESEDHFDELLEEFEEILPRELIEELKRIKKEFCI